MDGIITQILKKENPSLLGQLEFDSEADCFYVYTHSPQTQIKFVPTLVPIFNNLIVLET